MDIRRSFSSKQNKLANELNSISQTSNIERTDIIKRVSEEFNKITSQSVFFPHSKKVFNVSGKRARLSPQAIRRC